MDTISEDWQSGRSLTETNFYMLEHGIACDVTLLVGGAGDEQPAHKFILISRSCVFYAMFQGPLAETGDKVCIPDVEPNIMKLFLRYLYTEKVDLTADTVMALLYTGKKYCVQPLVEVCCSFLEENTCHDNVCTVLEQAHVFDEQDLQERCFDTIFANSAEIFSNLTVDICNLCRDCLKKILESEKLQISEEKVYLTCVFWAEEVCRQKERDISGDNLREVLGDVLFFIRFPIMDPDFFTKHVSTKELLTPEEIAAVYQTYDSFPGEKSGRRKVKFSSDQRITREIQIACRFEEIVGGIFDFWINDNLVDAISFSSSRDVTLTGVTIFAPFKDGLIRGRVRVYDESNWILAKKEAIELYSNNDQKTVDVEFKKSVKIKQEKWYTVTQEMIGAKSHHGKRGQRRVAGKNITFTFRRSPMDRNNTNVESGQIYALLYY